MILMLLPICGDIESCPGPASFRKENDFTILRQHVCGVASKKDILENFILEKNIKIFGGTETLLQNATTIPLVDIRGCIFERNDRSSKGGSRSIHQKEN